MKGGGNLAEIGRKILSYKKIDGFGCGRVRAFSCTTQFRPGKSEFFAVLLSFEPAASLPVGNSSLTNF